jgi:hypothetical protein
LARCVAVAHGEKPYVGKVILANLRVNFMKSLLRVSLFFVFLSVVFALQNAPAQRDVPREAPLREVSRPQYRLYADVDYELLTFRANAVITVPVAPGDSVRDAVFFIYANAGGVGGGADARRKYISVNRVTLAGRAMPFALNGAVLRVQLPQAQNGLFELTIQSQGVVPRAPAGSGGLADMLGGLGSLGGSLDLGGGTKPKTQNADYGLYTYGDGILSLGSFWYPQLAMRQNGKWIDEAPEGLGDVAFSEMSDYEVTFNVPEDVIVAATGNAVPVTVGATQGRKMQGFRAPQARDFAVLMSEDWTTKSKVFEVAGRAVTVEAFTLKKDTAKTDKAIDVSGRALQIYGKRFGLYLYDNFKVVQGPIRGGAGGMEFTGLTSIASMLYGDLGAQMGQLADVLGAGNLDQILGGFEDDAPKTKAKAGAQKLPDNPASEMLGSLLGGQKEMFDSIFEMTIAHEVAHQWWAIGVGSDSQRAPFVDESLANYTAVLYFEDRYGKEKAQQVIDTHLRQTYSMGRMMGGPDRPANLRTSAYAGNVQYGAVVYGKGALYYDVVRRAMGDAPFFESLRTYYARYAGRLAAPRDLVNIFHSKAPHAKVPALYARWIEGAHGDADITGGKPMGVDDLLGGLLGGLGGILGGE